MSPHHTQTNDLKPWVIPLQANAECACAMENVLKVSMRSYDLQRPQVCVEETSTQLGGETRKPIPAAPSQPERVDYEDKRPGTAHLFMVFAPLAGRRQVKVTERRTAVDFAQLLRELIDEQYPQAETVVLVMDNLNTHKPAEARRLLKKLEMHYMPKDGCWLNMAETEFNVLARQCLDRRIPDPITLIQEVAAWQQQRHAAECRVHWRFTTEDARIKLKRLYPLIQLG